MAPSNVEYPVTETKETDYTHKKFGKKSYKEVTPTPLFRPYALDENTPRKRRQDMRQQQEQTQQVPHQLPPTPPISPPQQLFPYQQYYHQQLYLGTSTPLNHQTYSYVLQKQRAVLQIRQLLNINPDANTWPLEWRQTLQSLLQQ